MTPDQVISAISTVGFPIAVCLFVLYRLETSMKANTEAINQLKLIIERLIK